MTEGTIHLLMQAEVIWFLVGLTFMLLEFVLPGLIIVFFGAGCWLTSVLLLLFPELSFSGQLLLFLSSSIALLILLRKTARKWIGSEQENRTTDELLEQFIGKKVIVAEDFGEEEIGKVTLNGTLWEAECSVKVKKGKTVRIIGKESIKLRVEPFN
jgi:membrane protein implicated in regulation of membrane protease activity